MNSTTLTLLALNSVLGVVIPLLLSLITKVNAPEQFKAALTALVSVVVGVITPFATGAVSLENFDWKIALLSVAQTYFTVASAHGFFWKPVGVTGPDGSIQAATGGFGVGSNSTGGSDVTDVPDNIVPPADTVIEDTGDHEIPAVPADQPQD